MSASANRSADVGRDVEIRPAVAADLPQLAAVERSGGAQFRDLRMGSVADAEPPPASVHAPACAAGRLWVAAEGEVAGFVRVEIVDGLPHVEQLSVLPAVQRRGVGARLLATAEEWARAHGHERMTLRTFVDVPWNAPFYARRGWVPIVAADEGPQLAALGRHEADVGLTVWPRTAMARRL